MVKNNEERKPKKEASDKQHLSPLGFSSSFVDSSRDIVEAAATKKPRIQKNTSSMASETLQVGPLGFYSTGDSLSDLLEAETKQQRIQENTSSMASETLHLSPLDFYSSVGYSSSDLVEATATKKPTIRKNTSSVASDTPHLNPPGFSSSIVDSSSEFVEASTVSEITHTNVGRNPSDSWDDEEYSSVGKTSVQTGDWALLAPSSQDQNNSKLTPFLPRSFSSSVALLLLPSRNGISRAEQ
ncbi:uncharacterized protein LOC130511083 [Raphanus sativus]|uniref:Uncharacterized protein LOC130511083 n=1 Tax=Raphanus sativus TaxID=3726 RepID=A0A9W3DJ32_RAPSA|nr:uncharacterized protein LOC130511083 [Raphanus sativus]